MTRRGISLSILIVFISIGLFIGTIRIVSINTILNPVWYTKIENNIFYAQRLASEINTQVKEIFEAHEVPVANYFSFLTANEVQEILKFRTETVLKMNEDNYIDELTQLNQATYLAIQNKLDDTEEELLKTKVVEAVGQKLIKIEDFETYKQRVNLFNVIVYKCSKPIGILTMMCLLVGSTIGLLKLHRFKLLRVIEMFSWSFVITGFWCHLLAYLVTLLEEVIFLDYIPLNQELTLYAHKDMTLLILIFAKGFLLVGVSYLCLVFIFREYRRLKLMR